MVLDQLLFKITKDHVTQEFKPLLCIPTSKINMLLHYFHSSLLGGHMGMTKMYELLLVRGFSALIWPTMSEHILLDATYVRLPNN